MSGPPQTIAAAPQDGRRTVNNRKNFVAIQMKPHAWIDEGIEQCLDNLQKGAVNTVWAYTYDWEMGPRNTPNGTIPLPDHGKYGDPAFSGGAFFNYDPKYFRGTMLSQFRSPDYGNWDVIAEVAPKAKARGMDFFCWDYNNESRRMMQNMPNAAKTLNTSGLTTGYLEREVKRARDAAGPEVKLYPGIDIDVPTRLTDKRTKPDDVRKSVRAAFDARADGVVLAREYVEMWLANLTAAGETLREIFAAQG